MLLPVPPSAFNLFCAANTVCFLRFFRAQSLVREQNKIQVFPTPPQGPILNKGSQASSRYLPTLGGVSFPLRYLKH